MNDGGRMLRLLLVEDNRGDAFLIKEMLRDTGIELKIDRRRGRAERAGHPQPLQRQR